jgi:hypothetical protein
MQGIPMTAFGRRARISLRLARVFLIGLLLPAAAHAQSLTQGALRGSIVATGLGVSDVALTVEDEGGAVVRRLRTDDHGQFTISVLPPGTYSLLIEKAGFQPLRQRGVFVRPGQQTDVRASITRRPPPITSVEESAVADLKFIDQTPQVAEELGGAAYVRDGNRLDLAESGRFATGVVAPSTKRWGFGDVVGSLPQFQSALSIDALPAFWMRHPGVENDPAGSPLAPPVLQQGAQLVASGSDAELRGAPGGQVSVVNRPGTRSFRLEPFASFGISPGLGKALNPGDSSFKSMQVGAVVSGTLVKDRAQFLASGVYEALNLPSARPWAHDQATVAGNPVPLAQTITDFAADSFNYDAGRYTRPALRTYSGGAGSLQVDWQLSKVHRVTAQAGAARHTEDRPELGRDLLNGADSRLESKDFLGSLSFTSTGTNVANEFRIGYQSATRDWKDKSPSATYFIAEQAGIGTSPALPGHFQRDALQFQEVMQYQFGSSGQHRLKSGLSYGSGTWDQDYLHNAKGTFDFGNLDLFGDGRGVFSQASAARTKVSFPIRQIGIFSHLSLQLSPRLAGLVGLRWDRQKFPNKLVIDTAFTSAFGIRNQEEPNDNVNLSPRVGLTWRDGSSTGWTVSLIGAIDNGQLNPARFAEAMLNRRNVRVRRAITQFTTWPTPPDLALVPAGGRQFAVFSPTDDYRDPRTTKLDLDVQRALPAGLTLRLTGRYHHTDYLLQRSDLNLLPTPTGTTQEGRQVFGSLQKSGGLLVAAPNSNRRLTDYDLVSGFSSTAAQDFYEASASLSRELGHGLSFSGAYSLSRTRDNWLQSWTGDPADELSPFPGDPVGGGWAKGVSDFDIPQRVAISTNWSSAGRYHVTVTGRYRYQSGFPFTPGFQPGVDANGDGSGRNDPAFVDANIPGMPAVVPQHDCLTNQVGKFAKRNSCREAGRHALDLGGSVAVRLRSIGRRVEVTLDIVNLVSSKTGIEDHALVLVDPAGTLVTDASGNVTLPLMANPRFGKLLSRRDEPRILRLGLRLGNW